MKYLLGFLVVLLVISGCRKKETELIEEIHMVSKITLRDVIVQTGEVRPVIKVDLKSEASGRIDKVYVKEGQRVLKGDKVLDIDPSRLLYRKDKMDLSVKKALIKKNLAKRNYDDAKKLLSTGSVSARSISDSKSDFELAEITWKQELLELKDLTDQLNKTKVISPMEGIITSLDVEVGEIAVSATSGFQSGTAIATISDISKLEVISQIGEVDYIHLKTNQKVIIKPEAIEGTNTTGTINFIALSAKKQREDELGTFEVRIGIDSLIPGIAPGINVNVEFVILEKSDVLGVPNHFVNKTQKGYIVKKITGQDSEGKKIEKVKIKIGKTDYKHYEILNGLKEGDKLLFTKDIDNMNQKKQSKGKHKKNK